MALCPNCKRRLVYRFGLCADCVRDPVAVAQFGTGTPRAAKKRQQYRDREPTAEEVERTIAEQMQRLPHWWPA